MPSTVAQKGLGTSSPIRPLSAKGSAGRGAPAARQAPDVTRERVLSGDKVATRLFTVIGEDGTAAGVFGSGAINGA